MSAEPRVGAGDGAPPRAVGPWAATGWRWGAVLAALQLPLLAFLWAANAPGRANNDIRNQADQALGTIPFSDWHPPVMSALWEALLRLTGQISSLLAVQLLGLLCCGWLLARLIARYTGRRWLSLAGVLFPLAPAVLSQAGILFKDTQMGVALLLALLLLERVDGLRPRSWWWLLPALTALGYGAMVRRNALVAALPFIAFVAWQAWRALRARREARGLPPRPRRRLSAALVLGLATLVGTGVFAGATLAADKVIVKLKDVQRTGQSNQIMLDDVIFTVPADELRASDLSPAFKEHLLSAQALCAKKGVIWDAYWKCYGRGVDGKYYAPIADGPELKRYWLATIPQHPARYLEYRFATYGLYLGRADLVWWDTGWRKDAVPVGLGNAAGPADDLSRWWVLEVWQKHLGWIYLPWFWLAAGAAALVAARWAGRARALVLVAASSALLYQLAYFPVIPAAHFRYTWWPAVALTAAWTVLAAVWIGALTDRRSTAGRRG
ncbi:hypothetical protein [Galactobacter valiniphilus]|uniref:hypothetical protein n=1 Tax=Galactobacter valiniphilus TaxID=2676122 RepID=UPI003736355F